MTSLPRVLDPLGRPLGKLHLSTYSPAAMPAERDGSFLLTHCPFDDSKFPSSISDAAVSVVQQNILVSLHTVNPMNKVP